VAPIKRTGIEFSFFVIDFKKLILNVGAGIAIE